CTRGFLYWGNYYELDQW
nr:immunoglobulin heavy chain junction region [Macaca mulatta]MOV54867.1 immunoglobulin heavy chain junction region [Macaca mulatta]MOV55044.1 immunoglobulin heavy chain junction region [Macaca mulatta]MOV55145.1 immunoglobulin heavy chain junction region [Macaca mulatta]MOV55158.1 immunoglobulin heavy chain junction region [Macaca mulatta]